MLYDDADGDADGTNADALAESPPVERDLLLLLLKASWLLPCTPDDELFCCAAGCWLPSSCLVAFACPVMDDEDAVGALVFALAAFFFDFQRPGLPDWGSTTPLIQEKEGQGGVRRI